MLFWVSQAKEQKREEWSWFQKGDISEHIILHGFRGVSLIGFFEVENSPKRHI